MVLLSVVYQCGLRCELGGPRLRAVGVLGGGGAAAVDCRACVSDFDIDIAGAACVAGIGVDWSNSCDHVSRRCGRWRSGPGCRPAPGGLGWTQMPARASLQLTAIAIRGRKRRKPARTLPKPPGTWTKPPQAWSRHAQTWSNQPGRGRKLPKIGQRHPFDFVETSRILFEASPSLVEASPHIWSEPSRGPGPSLVGPSPSIWSSTPQFCRTPPDVGAGQL